MPGLRWETRGHPADEHQAQWRSKDCLSLWGLHEGSFCMNMMICKMFNIHVHLIFHSEISETLEKVSV